MKMLMLTAVALLIGCTTVTPNHQPNVSAVDVPDTLLNHKSEFKKPSDGSSEAVFSALKDNKAEIEKSEYDRQLMTDFMMLSDRSNQKIKIHDMNKMRGDK